MYYDFEVAVPGEHPKNWKYQNIKLLASNPRAALILKQYGFNLHKNPVRLWKHDIKTNDIVYLAYQSVRRIHEYEAVRKQGKTVFQFKKVAEYKIDDKLKVRPC
jgi:hypothetical protein